MAHRALPRPVGSRATSSSASFCSVLGSGLSFPLFVTPSSLVVITAPPRQATTPGTIGPEIPLYPQSRIPHRGRRQGAS
jgi:hypothetical protein